MRKIKVAELTEDFSLYPRQSVDSQHVAELCAAIESGAELPAITIDKKSKRIIDGFHRSRAAVRLDPDNAEVMCIEKTYRTVAAMFEDAMRLNAGHGRRLTAVDKTHCAVKAAELGVDPEIVAGVLHVDASKLGKLTVARTAKYGKQVVSLKRPLMHLSGTKLTKSQFQANSGAAGNDQRFLVNQLLSFVQSNSIDTSDEKLMASLDKLRDALNGMLVGA